MDISNKTHKYIKQIAKNLRDWYNEPITIDLSGLFADKREKVTLQITPDKTLTNEGIEGLVMMMTDIYNPFKFGHRIKLLRKGLRISHNNIFSYEIYFKPDLITFYITSPSKWKELVKGKLEEVFSKNIAIEKANRSFNFDLKYTEAAELVLKKNEFMSLKTDKRTLAPLPGLMSAVKAMKEGDKALLQIVLEPLPYDWGIKAEEAYKKYKKGNMPIDKIIDIKTLKDFILMIALYIANLIVNVLLEIFTGEEGENYFNEVKKKRRPEELTAATKRKYTQRGLRTSIRVLSQSKDTDRAKLILKNITGSFNDLSGDNELVTKKSLNKTIVFNQVKTIQMTRIKSSKLSTAEAAKLIQLPPNSLQNEYKQIDSIGYNTPNLPGEFKTPGILIGKINHRGKKHKIFMPDNDPDLYNRPLGIIGPMKSGKSVLGSNIAYESFLRGIGSAVIDAADGKLSEDIKEVIPKELAHKVIELDFGNIDRPIGLSWSEALQSKVKIEVRLASELVTYFQKITGELGPRTRRWLKKSALAVFEDSNNTILEIVLMLVDDQYRNKIIPNVKNQSVKSSWIMFNRLSPGERSQIIQPILNRLDYLLDDENIKNCLCQRAKKNKEGKELINFRKWMDEGYLILVKAPTTILGETATDYIISFLISKIWLAALTRIDLRNKGFIPKSFNLIYDEPHQYMSSVENWKRMIVESRKWGLKLIYLFHSFAQIKEKDRTLSNLFKAAGMNYILFNGSKDTFVDLKEEIDPYTVEEALNLPQYYGIFRFYGNKGPTTFIAKAIKPLNKRYKTFDNSFISKRSAEVYGTNVKEVEDDIFRRESCLLDVNLMDMQQETVNTGLFEMKDDIHL